MPEPNPTPTKTPAGATGLPHRVPRYGDTIDAASPSGTPIAIRVQSASIGPDGTLRVREAGSHDIYEFTADAANGWTIHAISHGQDDDPLAFPPIDGPVIDPHAHDGATGR